MWMEKSTLSLQTGVGTKSSINAEKWSFLNGWFYVSNCQMQNKNKIGNCKTESKQWNGK